MTTKTKISQLKAEVLGETKVMIKPPNFAMATVTIVGTAPYLQNRFSSENRAKMEATQKEGSSIKRGKKAKPPKDWTTPPDLWSSVPTTQHCSPREVACWRHLGVATKPWQTIVPHWRGIRASRKAEMD